MNSYPVVSRDTYAWMEVLHGSNYGNITHQKLSTYIKNPQLLENFSGVEFSWSRKEITKNSLYLIFEPLHKVFIIFRRHGLKESIRRIMNRITGKVYSEK